jgi:putative ABC transport system permease protein
VEAIVLCLIGGAIGLGAGQGITSAIVALSQNMGSTGLAMAHIPPSAVFLALGFSTFVGVTFGMFPAIKAAMLDPIEALRHE